MLCRVALSITYVKEECIASILRVTRIIDLGTTLEVTSNRSTLRRNTSSTCHPDDGGDIFLRNVGYSKSRTASHPIRRILDSQRRQKPQILGGNVGIMLADISVSTDSSSYCLLALYMHLHVHALFGSTAAGYSDTI
jgi:hypothetical protein